MLAPTVLLVDDDPSTLDFVAYTLQARGYRVIEASDAAEALQAASSYNGPIPLLLTDVVMPNVDGLELADQIRVQRPETKVLYITAYPHTLEPGKHPMVEKPFTQVQLLAKIQEVLSRKN